MQRSDMLGCQQQNFCMKVLFSVFFLLTVLSCSKRESETPLDTSSKPIAGVWKEYQRLADPGDGSGVYREIDGSLLVIYSNSSYSCIPEHFVWGKKGKIEILTDSTLKILPDPAVPGEWFAMYGFRNGDLEIGYSCIEGCNSRFRRMKTGN